MNVYLAALFPTICFPLITCTAFSNKKLYESLMYERGLIYIEKQAEVFMDV